MAETVVKGGAVAGGELNDASIIDRQCTVDITNACEDFSLSNPSMYLHSGFCKIPPPPVIGCEKPAEFVFSKPTGSVKGSISVIMFDIQNNETRLSTEKLVLMFFAPFDYNLYSNIYAAGIFDYTTGCDKVLYKKMKNGKQIHFVRKYASDNVCLTYKTDTFTIQATMSDAYQPVIKLRFAHKCDS